MTLRRRVRHRAFVLVAVLVIVSCAILVATGVAFLVRGEVAGAGNAAEATRLHAAGWSAVQAVAARIGAQREEILAGGTPRLEASFALWESSNDAAMAQLLPLGPAGEVMVAEGGKLDLASVTPESLSATEALDGDLADRLLARRGALGRVVDVDALLGGEGAATVSMSDLHGPLEEISLGLDEDERVRSGDALRDLLAGGAEPRGAADLLTTFAYDAALDAGGEPRVALSGEWTDDKRGAIDALLGTGSARLLEDAIKAGAQDEAAILAVWRSKHPDPKEWALFLDRVAWSTEWTVGRVDLMRASAAALKALPGITDEVAGRIVRERDAVPPDERRTPAWIATRGIVDPETFTALAPRLTTRSLFWRVRVAARFVRDERDEDAADQEGETLGRTSVLEAVIDVSGPTPRVAFLRDLGALDTVVQLVLAAPTEAAPEAREARPELDSDPGLTPPVALPPDDLDAEPSEPASSSPDDGAPSSEPPRSPAVPRVPGVGRWRSAG